MFNDVIIGKGKYDGKGVYAARNFDTGDVVLFYNLKRLTPTDFINLPRIQRNYVHSFWGKMYLFSEPACYVNHSADPNTKQDLHQMCDVAIKPIKKGEMITTNATIEWRNELETFIEVYEKKKITDFERLSGGYRNAIVRYSLSNGTQKTIELKRVDGNWHIICMSTVYEGLSPYSSDWGIQFEKEKELLIPVFENSFIEIEHIGSTAIEGLPSKPIVDIAVMIENSADADNFTPALSKIGFTFHSKSTERHFYQKRESVHYNLSIAYANRGGFWPRQILFRDYLRSHSEVRDEYAAVKSKLIAKYPNNIDEYSEGKTEFVQKVLDLAGWKDGLTYNGWKAT